MKIKLWHLKVTLWVVTPLLAIAIVAWMIFLSGAGIVPPFSKVTVLGRTDRFADSFVGEDFLQKQILDPRNFVDYLWLRPNLAIPKAAMRPDRHCYYVSGDSVHEYDEQRNYIRTISLSDFGLPGDYNQVEYKEKSSFEIWQLIQTSNDKLWLQVFKTVTKESSLNKTDKRFEEENILEWNTVNAPDRAKIFKLPSFSDFYIAIDPCTNFAYIFNRDNSYVYNLSDSSIVKKFSVGNDSVIYADFNAKNGILLSTNKPYFAIFDIKTLSVAKILEGYCARWGADNYIYFVLGNTQLWRCQRDGSNREPVYLAARCAYGDGALSLRIGSDPNFIMFRPTLAGRSQLVLIDLQEKEFCVIKQRRFGKGW